MPTSTSAIQGIWKASRSNKRQDFTAESIEAAGKLARLKQKIRGACDKGVCELREDYANPEQLGEWILEDFTKLIDRLYPKDQAPDPLEQEASRHEVYAQSRRLAFVGREDLLHSLNEHVAKGNNPLVLTGDSGCGKSALLAEWVARWRKDHPHDLIIQHYFGSTPGSADWQGLVHRILRELKQAFAITDDIPFQPDALRSALNDWAVKAIGSRQIVLVLDALNQLDDDGEARQLGWLPVVFPANFHVLVSTLPGESLDALRRRGWAELHVPLFHRLDIASAAKAYFKVFSKTPPSNIVAKLESTPSTYNALYLRAVLDELRQFGKHEELETKADHYLSAPDLPDLFNRILARWERDYGADLVTESLSLIWASRHGLSEAEILDLLGEDGQRLPRAKWTPLYLAVESNLTQGFGLLKFSHSYIRKAVCGKYLKTVETQKSKHQRLAKYFDIRKDIYPRKVAELFWQLRKAGAWDELAEQLKHADLVQETWNTNHFDVSSSWTELETFLPGSLSKIYAFILGNPDGYVWLSGRHEGTAHFLFMLAWTFRFCGYTNESFVLCDTVLKHFSDGNPEIPCNAVILQCCLFIERGISDDLQTAWELLLKLSQVVHGTNNYRITSQIMSAQETILLENNQTEDALRVIQKHKELLQEINDRHGLADCLGNEAVACTQMGKSETALKFHQQEENLCRELGDLDGLQMCLGNQANVLATKGLFQEALSLLIEQEHICSRIGKMASLANCYSNQAFLYAKQKQLDRAAELLKRQEILARHMGSEKQLQIALEAQKAVSAM